MVDEQIAGRGIRDPAVLAALRKVSRAAFVPEAWRDSAYEDGPIPIGAGQTISQPYIVALMLEAAHIGARDRVLEVGSGSGYVTALASLIAAKVYAIERQPGLADASRERLRALGYAGNVELRCGDGSGGWPEAAPFDAIIVSAGAPRVPAELRDQLAPGGRLVLPVGPEERSQRLLKVTRRSATRFDETTLCAVRFVPLIGAHAWPDAGAPPGRRASPRGPRERRVSSRDEPPAADPDDTHDPDDPDDPDDTHDPDDPDDPDDPIER